MDVAAIGRDVATGTGARRDDAGHRRSGRTAHWVRPDPVGDILDLAWSTGTAPPREIHVSPEVYARVLAELAPDDRAAVEARHVLGSPVELPIVVDDDLPPVPGVEVVRVPPVPVAA